VVNKHPPIPNVIHSVSAKRGHHRVDDGPAIGLKPADLFPVERMLAFYRFLETVTTKPCASPSGLIAGRA